MKSATASGGIGADIPAAKGIQNDTPAARSMEQSPLPQSLGEADQSERLGRLTHVEQRLGQAERFMAEASSAFQTMAARIDALRGQLVAKQSRMTALDAAIKHMAASGHGTAGEVVAAAKEFAAFLDDNGPETVEPTVEAAPEIVRH